MVEDYDLQGRISVLVTDSAANMLAAFRFALAPKLAEAGAAAGDSSDEENEVRVVCIMIGFCCGTEK